MKSKIKQPIYYQYGDLLFVHQMKKEATSHE